MYLTLAPTFVLPESLPLCFACTDVRSLLSRILDLSSLVNVHAILLSRSMYDVICSLWPLSLFLARSVALSLSHTRPPARVVDLSCCLRPVGADHTIQCLPAMTTSPRRFDSIIR